VILTGRGDARLSSAPDCVANCLAALADAVAARTRRVGDVVGDDSLFRDQRWSPGVSWEDLQERYGTAVSALTLDDNELSNPRVPGAVGSAPRVEALPYYEVDNRAVTVAAGRRARLLRLPGSQDRAPHRHDRRRRPSRSSAPGRSTTRLITRPGAFKSCWPRGASR
jgi:D-alanyl-D-alanine carboxypeptidase/D-alanyl-D-alanine-endopeptidase (penicillin-binding protein 4)